MAQDVTLPDGQIASFPDEMDDAQITSILRRDFPQWGPKQTAESGIIGTLGGGFAQTGRAVGAFADTLQHDTPELQAAAAAQAARVKDPRLAAFEADLAQRRERLGKDPGWLDVIGEVGSAAWKNPAGAGLMTVDQLPNSAAVLAGAGVGAAAGTALGPAGTAVGGIVGGLGGMFAGNLAVEGGNRALEHVSKTGGMSSEDRSRLLYEGAIKAGVITGVDAVTFGMTKFLTNASRRAVETATLRVAEQAGVSATEIAARRAADPAFDAAIMSAQKLAMDGATTFGKRALQTGAALGLETIGEGLGEYLGEFAATGEADKMDAVIEAFSSLGQSAAEVGIAKAWNSRNIIAPIAAAKAPEDAIAAAEAALAAPIEPLEANVNEWKAAEPAPLGLPYYAGEPLVTFPDGTTMTRAEYEQRGSGLGTMPAPADTTAANAPLINAASQQAQVQLSTVQADEGTTDIETMRPKTILKRATSSIGTDELRSILASPETSAVTARAVHAELAARERAATPTVEGTGGTNELRTTMGSTTLTVPDAAPAKTNTLAEAVAILRTPVEQRVPADTMRLRNVAARVGPEVMGRIEQFVKGPFGLTRDERVAAERLIASDARVAPAAKVVPATLPQSATQQQLADNEAGKFSQPRKSMFRNSQLRSETGPDIKGERVTRIVRKALVQMGRITGTKVIFEYAPEDSDGVLPNRAENTIHINTAARINPMQVMGHEVTHVLRARHEVAWNKVRDALVATMPDKRKALEAFADNYLGVPSRIGLRDFAKTQWVDKSNEDRLALEKFAEDHLSNPTAEDRLALKEFIAKRWNDKTDADRIALEDFAKSQWGKLRGIDRLAAALAMPDWSVQLTPEQQTQFGTSENTIEDFLLDEMVSDLGGQHWSSEKFWVDVFAKIAEQEGDKARSIIERLVISIKEMLNKFIAVVRAHEQDDFVTVSAEQLEATRDAITTAYAKLIRAERRTEPDQGPHVTDHRIGTSDTHSRSQGGEGDPAPAVPPVPAATGDEDELSDARARELASLSPARPMLDTLQDIERGKLTMDGEYGYNTFQSLWKEADGLRSEYPDERTYDIYKDLGGTGVVYGASGYNRYSVKPDGSLAPIPESFSNKDTLAKARAALDAPKLSTQRLFFEAAPNPDDKTATQQWREAGRFGRSRIDERVRKVIVPGLLKDLRITGEIMPQLGGWMDATNPSFALVVSKGDPALAARAIGYVLDQQAMYMLGLERFTGAERTGIIHFDITGKDAHKIYMQVRALDTDKISGHSTVGNEMYIGVPADRMQALRQSVVEIARTNNLTVSFDEGYGATIKEYGYGIQGERQVARGLRATARDVDRWRAEADALRSDAAGRRSDRTGVARKSEQRPSYGEGSGEQVVGVHYSRQQRDTLSSAYFGTGMKAQERFRIAGAKDPRIKKRLYFYANTGKGIAPESDVGHHAHSVTLNNIYDMDVDPKRLYKILAEGDPYQSPDSLMNDFESGVIDEGFDGYMTREFGRGGAVVLLGAHSVPVQYEGERARPDVPTMPAPKFSDEQALRRKLMANRALPAGKMTGLEWKRALKREMPELDPRWLDNDQTYRRDELIPRSEPARMSESRPPAWWYSPLARAADAATMKKAPASGWKSWLKSLAAKGVKPDEIKWSGIEEWLDVQGEAVVTREQVQAYLSEFGVRIETILRGESNPVTDSTQEVDAEDSDINLDIGEWETDDPDEGWLAERASERLQEELEARVESEADAIESDLRASVVDEIDPSEYRDEVLRDMGSLFDPSDEEVRAEAKRRAVIAWVNDMWQGFADDTDITFDTGTEEEIETAINRAFDVAMGDLAATRDEAERRARAEIDEDNLLEELIEQERSWHYMDSEAPNTRQITVDGVDGVFYHNYSYGEHNLYYDGHNIPLPRRADDADVEGAIRNYVMEEGLVAGAAGGDFRATKWDDHTTDKNRAVPGSYREVQLTLPVGAFGLPKSRLRETPRITYTVYDAEGEAVASMAQEENAKERADKVGGTYKEVVENTETKRMSVTDYYYTTHWQEANVVGFARWDEHRDEDGKRVMVLQEVQGDWGQQRREGLAAQEKAEKLIKQIDAKRQEVADARKVLADLLPDVNGWDRADWLQVETLGSQALEIPTSMTDEHTAAERLMKVYTQQSELQREYDSLSRDLPDAAPFIEKTPQWAGLVLKRMIAHAIEAGFDKVVWTSGAQQVERWKGALRKQVDTIAWEKTPDGIHITASQRGSVRTDTRVSETALSDAIGKQMSKQIIADPNQSGEITGDDITISDTGMAGFYDRMLPTIANDILRKFDKDVRVKDIEVHEFDGTESDYTVAETASGNFEVRHANYNQPGMLSGYFNSREDAERELAKHVSAATATRITTQQGFDITDKLRESVANGVPLFSQRRASAEARLSHARKEWYRSQLSEAVGGLPAKIKTGKEAALWLTSNAGKLQVKKDELNWSGVLDWLATQRSVTGAQIQDWLASNGVRVKDVMLGEDSPEYKRLDAELQEQDAEVTRLRKIASNLTQDEIELRAQMSISAMRDAASGNDRKLKAIGYNQEQYDAMLEYGKALNRKNELFEQRKAARGETPKHDSSSLRIPGGKPGTYRELLLVLPGTSKYKVVPHPDVTGSFAIQKPDGSYMLSGPDTVRPGTTLEWESEKMADEGMRFYAKDQFRSSHYPQPDILAHLRFEEMIDADGKRVLFIQEVQSDWGQKGRKEGFAGTERTAYQVVVDGNPAGAYESMAEAEAAKQRALKYNTPEKVEIRPVRGKVQDIKGVPAAPFVTDTKAWVALALKRAISHAVDNGFDRVAWTTGEQQNDRYDLSKQVSYIRAIRNSDDTYWVLAVQNREGRGGTGDVLFDKDKLTEAELENTIGKDLTQKIIKQEKRKEHEYTGLDLKVGGEGMVAFYDGIVKQVARSLGATVGTVSLPNPYRPSASGMTIAEADANLKAATAAWKPTQPQPGFDITERMKEQAAIGMPLFSTKRKPLDQWLGRSVVRKPMYHGTARDITTFRPQQADAIFLTDDPAFAANFADMSHSWMVNNYWTWMSPDQIQQAKRDAMRMLLQDALPGSSLYMREERLLNQSQFVSQYMRRAVEQYMPSESNIMPLYVRAENPFDYRNPEHVAAIEREIGTSWMGYENIHGAVAEVAQHIGDLERGDWNAIESEPVQRYIRANHDSFYVRERGVTNLAVFSPNQVKSASGNDGSYSREDNDIRRSEPRPVDTLSAAFRAWFGDSKVTDEQGKPLRVFHGTQRAPDGIDGFVSAEGYAGQESAGLLWFASSAQDASNYADWVRGFGNATVYPVYLSMQNPATLADYDRFVADMRDRVDPDPEIGLYDKRIVDRMKAAGFDGIMWSQKEATGSVGFADDNDTTYVVFRPEQVKSAISNTGEFDPTNPDIRRSESRQTLINELKNDPTVFWHGSPSGSLRGAKNGLHLGSYEAARQALNARIGTPTEGDWDGTREYGKTPLGYGETGYSAGAKKGIAHFANGTATYSDGTKVALTLKPDIVPFRVTGPMTNSRFAPYDDSKANGYMSAAIKRGNAKNGYYYTNIGEDSGSISVVVPSALHLERVDVWRDIYSYSTPRSRLNGQPINQSWSDPDMTDWDDFVRKMQDKMVDTKRVVKAIREAGVAIAEKFDPYMQEILFHGRAASRVKNFADTELRQLLEDMSHRGVVMQDLDDYLWARHAPERNAANARSNPAITDGSGMTDAQAADILAGRAVTINGRTIQLSAQTLRGAAALATRVDAITNRTLDLLVEYKLETQQTVDTWKRTYAHYAPLKRDMESDANYSGAFNLGLGTGKGFDIRGAASRRALGSKRSVVDILANVAMQRERAIVRGEKNRVSQAVYGLALTAPNPEFWIPVNPALNKGLSPAALAKLQAELVSLGVNPIDAQNIAREPVERYPDPKTGLEATRINPRLRSRDDVLSVRINGEDRYVFFSNKERAQRMVAGLKNLDADQLGAFLQTAAIGTRWFASVNTQFNPIFGITNGLRDLSTGMLNLSSTPLSANRAEIARNAFSALKGIYLDLRDHRAGRQPTSQWAQLFEQFALDGGQTGYRDMFQNSKARADEIVKELKHAGKGKQWVTGGEKHSAVFGWLSDYNTAVENAVRLSAYKAALDRGMTREAAAALAKNLTVNFNKKGLAATQTGALYAFFNAAVQGTARMAETMTTDGKLNTIGQKIVYGGIVLGVMQATLGMLAGWDDEEPPQYLREKNFLIPDLLTGSDKYLSIPMPLGFHVIPSVGRIATEWMMSGFKDPGKRLTRLAGVLLDAFNPIGGTGSIGQMLSPTITDPIIALGENKDWTGKPVFKEDFSKMQPTPGWTRTKDTASPISRWLSYAMNYATGGGKYEIGLLSPTPDQIDYLVGQATGGVGREILKTAQYVGAKVTGEELPLYKTPLGVGRFVGETKGQASETSRFYDNLRRIGEHKSALEEMKDARDGDALMRYLERHPDARLVQTADKAQREIGYLRRQKRELIEKGASKERVKMIEDKITGLTRRYNEVLAAKK